MEISLTDIANKEATAKITAADSVFGCEFNEPLVHQVVTAYLAGTRAGTKAQKTRSEVRGGGAKPWRQKGTGRARAGTSRSPIWRAGGVTFAAKPRDYSQKVNKKMYRGAMRAIFSELLRKEALLVVKEFPVATNKTKALLKILKNIEATNVLIVTDSVENNLYLAARNLPQVAVTDVAGINPVVLMKFAKIVITEAAFKRLEESYK